MPEFRHRVFWVKIMSLIHLDLETTSLANLSTVGGYRYAEDPSTRILMFAIAEDGQDPVLWRFDQPDSSESLEARAMLEFAICENYLIYAHNYQFELALLHHRLAQDVGVTGKITLENYRCTQAMCRRAAIPESLNDATSYLNLPQQKTKIGSSLIKIFSDQTEATLLDPPLGMIDPESMKPLKRGGFTKGKPPKRMKTLSPILEEEIPWDWRVRLPEGVSMTVREAWELFCEYCRQDVRAEMALHTALKKFELTGDELASFQFDMRMNFRGAPFNRPALRNAQKLIGAYQERLELRMHKMCDLTSSQGKKLTAWLKERGYPEDNLQADTVEAVLSNPPSDMTPLALEVLRHRALLSFAAIKKIPTMLGAAMSDGRVRGTKTWHGARTGRGTSKLVQMDNMKKATIKDSALAYQMICDGFDLSWFEELWDSPLEVMSSCTRHFVQLPDGEEILDADYTGVEARIAPWISDETEKMDSILAGLDQYKVMAAEIIFHTEYDRVTKEQRTVGKPVELSCCYGTGGEGLLNSLCDTYKVTRFIEMRTDNKKEAVRECERIVNAYRKKFNKMVTLWGDIEKAAKAAISTGERTQVAGGRLGFGKIHTAGREYLVIRLPSGRRMYYPEPKITSVYKPYTQDQMDADHWKFERKGYWIESISFYGKHDGVWRRIHTWGSRLFENICQAIGADLLNYGMIQAEKEGYGIFMCIHDQALAESNGQSLEGYIEALCRKQPWADTFPLDATGFRAPYYLKED